MPGMGNALGAARPQHLRLPPPPQKKAYRPSAAGSCRDLTAVFCYLLPPLIYASHGLAGWPPPPSAWPLIWLLYLWPTFFLPLRYGWRGCLVNVGVSLAALAAGAAWHGVFNPGLTWTALLNADTMVALAVLGSIVFFSLAVGAVGEKERRRRERREARLRRKAQRRLETDYLTGLGNSLYAFKKLEQAVATGQAFVLVTVDVERFRYLNLQHGYRAGNLVLREIGRALKRKQAAWAARYGADQFLVLFAEAAWSEVEELRRHLGSLAGEITTKLAAAFPGLSLRLNFGLARFPADGRTAEELLAAAERDLGRQRIAPTTSVHVYRSVLPLAGSGRLEGTMDLMLLLVDAKDKYTRAHGERVSFWAEKLAEALGLPAEDRAGVVLGALYHDVGKIEVPYHILNKPGSLATEEWEIVRQHPQISASFLEVLGCPPAVVAMVRHHHERLDGTGYPDGLAGDDIPFLARLLAVVDAFDALTTWRPYRPALAPAAAVAELKRVAGRQLDPDLVKALAAIVSRLDGTSGSG